jgi:hypothetical protein
MWDERIDALLRTHASCGVRRSSQAAEFALASLAVASMAPEVTVTTCSPIVLAEARSRGLTD